MRPDIEFLLYFGLFCFGCGVTIGWFVRGGLSQIELSRSFHEGRVKGLTESILYEPETSAPMLKPVTVSPLRRVK